MDVVITILVLNGMHFYGCSCNTTHDPTSIDNQNNYMYFRQLKQRNFNSLGSRLRFTSIDGAKIFIHDNSLHDKQ